MPSNAADASQPAATASLRLTDAGATPADVWAVARGAARVVIDPEVLRIVAASRQIVENALLGDVPIYGLNTGLGPRRNERVSPQLLLDYQRYIVLSHAGAVGDPLPDEDVRAILFARICGLARGGSGASPHVLQALVNLLNAGVLPLIPEIGSAGASDLAALAAVGEVLLGCGRARYQGEAMRGSDALARAGLVPVELRPKDALAIISANSVSIGVGAMTALQAVGVLRLADMAGALSLEAIEGNLSPFDPEVQRAKPYRGQADAAAHVRALLDGSFLHLPGACASLQDPLSFRTIPQVHGAVREQVEAALRAVTVELHSRADNPLVSIESGRVISNGNFHPMVLALAFDSLRTGLAHLAILSERRIVKLTAALETSISVDDRVRQISFLPERRRLPITLGYSAAVISSEIKQMASPATLFLPPLGRDVEDHGTLAPASVLCTRRAIKKFETLLSIEVLLGSALFSGHPAQRTLGIGTRPAFDYVSRLVDGGMRTSTAAELVESLRDALTENIMPGLASLDSWS